MGTFEVTGVDRSQEAGHDQGELTPSAAIGRPPRAKVWADALLNEHLLWLPWMSSLVFFSCDVRARCLFCQTCFHLCKAASRVLTIDDIHDLLFSESHDPADNHEVAFDALLRKSELRVSCRRFPRNNILISFRREVCCRCVLQKDIL